MLVKERIHEPLSITNLSLHTFLSSALTEISLLRLAKTCGLTQGLDSTEPEVKPPVVQVLEQGFTIITTNPDAGKFEQDDIEKTNRIYCSIYPNVPRDTDLLFKIDDQFFLATPL